MPISVVQRIRKFALCAVAVSGVALFALGTCTYDHDQSLHHLIRWAGILAMAACVVGRTWCALYIGGKKIEQLVTSGPYSVSRNPLYLFSVMGAAGAGAQFGSMLAAAVFGIITFIIFHCVVLQEEKLLMQRHGQAFAAYCASAPRFLPDLRLWRDVPLLTVKPRNVAITFLDTFILMLTIPLAELSEHLHRLGMLPVVVKLP
jgi:protein-S-isoprenylcysteine O-methyltransferase Ste14